MASNKYLANVAGLPTETHAQQTSAGVGDAGKIVALADDGYLDESLFPTGVEADVFVGAASEALAAGDFVNIHDVAGTPKVRKADASSTSKRAHGFVLASVLIAANATVYFVGRNTAVAGLAGGTDYFLSDVTPGLPSATPGSGAAHLAQALGVATSATTINVEIQPPVVTAA